MITEQAKAKINLYLDITGKRDDGYHTLSSLVMFADIADEITIRPAAHFKMSIQGPFAQSLDDEISENNLVARAARQFAGFYERDTNFEIILVKNLPVGAGIGGGSADAAATLRGLLKYWDIDELPDCDDLMLELGADVPMCFRQASQLVGGIGEISKPLSFGFDIPCLLVYPLQHVSTPDIFKALDWKEQEEALSQTMPSDIESSEGLIAVLGEKQNDLAPVAVSIYPVIDTVLGALNGLKDTRLARMSGSGSCCFALFDGMAQCENAASDLQTEYPDWWVCATRLRGT